VSTGADAIDPAVARRLGLERRRGLPDPERRLRTDALMGHLEGLTELGGPGRVATYVALADEVDVTAPAERWRAAGWVLHLPRLMGGGEMEFARFGPGDELVANRYGIGEPTGPAVGVADLDVVIVPCVAVDDNGTRVGFGAGYYDRALAATPRPFLVGVAFEVQRFTSIERRPWDVPLDVVVTDAGVLRP